MAFHFFKCLSYSPVSKAIILVFKLKTRWSEPVCSLSRIAVVFADDSSSLVVTKARLPSLNFRKMPKRFIGLGDFGPRGVRDCGFRSPGEQPGECCSAMSQSTVEHPPRREPDSARKTTEL